MKGKTLKYYGRLCLSLNFVRRDTLSLIRQGIARSFVKSSSSSSSSLLASYLVTSSLPARLPSYDTYRKKHEDSKDMGSSSSKGKSSKNSYTLPHSKHDRVVVSERSKTDQPHEPVVEEIVCKEDEISENEMKVFTFDKEDNKVLLVKQKGVIHAIGTKCSHYGAPLINGALGDGRVRCPWHGACFNIENGDIEDFPGLDNIPCFKVKVENGFVKVAARPSLLRSQKRSKSFVGDFSKQQNYVILGGGPSALNCAETLRQEGFTGQIMMVTNEKHLPYDRVKLSKSLDVEVDNITLRSFEFLEERGIVVKRGVKAVSVNSEEKTVLLSNEEALKYEKLYVATGASARQLNVKGVELGNIFYLRSIDDANRISSALKPESRVAIVGASFIGMEVSSYCVGKVQSITVLCRDTVPFKHTLGEEVGQRIMSMHKEKGVKFILQCTVSEFGGSSSVETVLLSNGATIDADVVIIGIGTVPNSSFLKGSGVTLLPNGTVPVDEYMETNVNDIYAGGDVATAMVRGQNANIGHWGLANYHGHMAAYNMLDMRKRLHAVPFFWTMMFGKSFRYAGFAPRFQEVIIQGSLQDLQFVAYYCIGNDVHAILTIQKDPLAAKFAEILHSGKPFTKANIAEWAD